MNVMSDEIYALYARLLLSIPPDAGVQAEVKSTKLDLVDKIEVFQRDVKAEVEPTRATSVELKQK